MKLRQSGFTKLVGFLVIMLILPLLVSCSSKPEEAIVGKWAKIGDESKKMELFKDGTITIGNKSMTLSGKYTFIDEERVKIELGGLGALAGPKMATVSISGDELTWVMSDGKITKYRREK